jgi:hypothetical protein
MKPVANFHRAIAAIALVAVISTPPAAMASGPPPIGPSYIDAFGGDTPDLERFYDGDIGIVTPASPRPRLFMFWRLLHSRPVGRAAGPLLSVPCCGDSDDDTSTQSDNWIQARKTVPGVLADLFYIPTDREGADGVSTPNCFAEAFAAATSTLQDRIKSYGADSPWVKAWVDAQDAVFAACSKGGIGLPSLDPAAPGWLKQDRAYQAAAQELYAGSYEAAAEDFAAIGHDTASPYAPRALYLVARVRVRAVIQGPTPATFAPAHKAVEALAAAPAGTFGQSQVATLNKLIYFREKPAALNASLAAALDGPTLDAGAASDYRDFVDLNAKATPSPPMIDWMATVKAQASGAPPSDFADPATELASQIKAREISLDHAVTVWNATSDQAWLVAALSLATPADSQTSALLAAADKIEPSSPAYLTVAYQRVRLTLASAPVDATRRTLDVLLARTDLSTTDRNLFLAERLQVAEDRAAFARLTLRRRLCVDLPDAPSNCVRGRYNEQVEEDGIYDASGKVGLGPDARALIDRLPMADRAALAHDASIPDLLRLDIAMTTWTRAVLAQDNALIDDMSKAIALQLPLMRVDLGRVIAAAPGPAKRFAEFFVLAKMPGLATDLQGYTRPQGKRIADFQGNWPDWGLLPPGSTAGVSTPPLSWEYQPGLDGSDISKLGWRVVDANSDLVCLTFCGAAPFPLPGPRFLADRRPLAERERKQMGVAFAADGKAPAGAVSIWEELFDYAQAHPADPRSPEALYWLGHISRYGKTHGHVGRRAFNLLHQRFPTTTWAKETKYFYD